MVWEICLNGLFGSLFPSIVRVGTWNEWIFANSIKLDPCVVFILLDVLKGNNFGCKVCFSFHVGMFCKFDSAPESFKKSIARSGV